jgi:hypothetical protein
MTGNMIPGASQTGRSKCMPAVRRTAFTEFVWKLYRFVYPASGGQMGGAISNKPILLPTTMGRCSRESRPVILT